MYTSIGLEQQWLGVHRGTGIGLVVADRKVTACGFCGSVVSSLDQFGIIWSYVTPGECTCWVTFVPAHQGWLTSGVLHFLGVGVGEEGKGKLPGFEPHVRSMTYVHSYLYTYVCIVHTIAGLKITAGPWPFSVAKLQNAQAFLKVVGKAHEPSTCQFFLCMYI